MHLILQALTVHASTWNFAPGDAYECGTGIQAVLGKEQAVALAMDPLTCDPSNRSPSHAISPVLIINARQATCLCHSDLVFGAPV